MAEQTGIVIEGREWITTPCKLCGTPIRARILTFTPGASALSLDMTLDSAPHWAHMREQHPEALE